MKRVAMALALWLVGSVAAAQQPSTPTPVLRATIDPPRVVVGQPAILTIELLAPNYLTAPPTFPDLQLHNAVTRPLGSINVSEPHEGITYAGVRREFAIHPQEPGAYEIAGQTIGVTYAADPPRSREATVALPRLAFEAFIPAAAQTLNPFIAATRLRLSQTVNGLSANLKVGDALVRTVTIEAEGIPAMLLPPTAVTAPDGIAIYPDEPLLTDKADSRTDVLTATRVDRVTYMPEKAADYVLPALDIAWWNVRDQKIEHAHVEPVPLHVAENPALQQGLESAGSPLADKLLARWPLIILLLAGVAGLGWLSPRAIRAAREWDERRQSAYRQSEAYFFSRLRSAARSGDPAATYFALLAWLERFDPVAPAHTIKAFSAAAQDAELDRQLALMEKRLFSNEGHREAVGSPRQLLRRVASARRRLLHRSAVKARHEPPLAPTLNPTAAPIPARTWLRRPAR